MSRVGQSHRAQERKEIERTSSGGGGGVLWWLMLCSHCPPLPFSALTGTYAQVPTTIRDFTKKQVMDAPFKWVDNLQGPVLTAAPRPGSRLNRGLTGPEFIVHVQPGHDLPRINSRVVWRMRTVRPRASLLLRQDEDDDDEEDQHAQTQTLRGTVIASYFRGNNRVGLVELKSVFITYE